MLRIPLVTLVVRGYDEAVAFYVGVLGLSVLEDTPLGAGRRWLVVGPAAGEGAGLLLAEAAEERQRSRVGDQTGGRVAFFLSSSSFAADHARLVAAGVRFLEQPRHEAYGWVAVFEDLYGNRWDLVGPAGTA